MTLTGLSGVYPIPATPFRTDRSVDEDDLGHLIDFIVTSGADGIVFPGVASEFETLESAERTRLVDRVAHCVAARVPLVVGVSAADPPLEPPAMRSVFHGLCTGPKCDRVEVPPWPNSSKLVLPMMIAPAV